MAEIKCPMCSKPNPAELDVCQYCEARLKPLTDELSRSQPPIHPGEEPTDMDTGQLEPILPQWLREVRQQARESAEESAEQAPVEEEAVQPEETADLLAGLRSQSEEDEEIPDWLAGLRGEAGQASSEETSTGEDDLAALKSMLGEETPSPQESEAGALPDWISDLGAGETGQVEGDELSTFLADDEIEEAAQTEPQTPASDSDFSWQADFEADSGPQADTTADDAPFDTELPAWLQGADETPKDQVEGDLPAWMSAEESAQVSEGEEATPPASEGDMPDWLSSLGEENAEAAPQPETEQPAVPSTTDWLSSLGGETTESPPQQEDVQPAAGHDLPDWVSAAGEESLEGIPQKETGESAVSDDMPDWLSALGDEGAEVIPPQEESQPAAEGDLPDWISSPAEESLEDVSQQEAEEPVTSGDVPDWLAALGEEGSEVSRQEEAQQPGETPDWLSALGEEGIAAEETTPGAVFEETSQPAVEGEMPDWLASMGEEASESEQPALETPALEEAEPVAESGAAPAFVDDEGKPISADDVEAIFSMDMPEWLSDAGGLAEGETAAASTEAQGDDLRPADLPSWVQAMRPVESVISETEGEAAEEQPMEERGPLAGLRGVLPAVPGVGPSSKPKAYSIKLQASEDQQANATLLEQMLAEEIHPKPVGAQKVVLTQRLLRWAISILLLLAVIVGNGTRINPIPTGVPLETSAALDYIRNTLPANAPVLLIFDYEAALAGELEASAAPLVDLMLTLKAPRLSLLASTPTGSGLAERFMRTLQTDREYERDKNFTNLGYLPGGAAGVLAFSSDPLTTKPLTTTGTNARATEALQGVEKLSNFNAIILLTDNVETARIWIEQTEAERGETPLLVISSAQSGPMILPYYQSGQVAGMVTGLDGSAPIEQANSGRPGMVRRYWDAYGFGLLTAVVMITLGSLWSLVSGWQARRKEQGEE